MGERKIIMQIVRRVFTDSIVYTYIGKYSMIKENGEYKTVKTCLQERFKGFLVETIFVLARGGVVMATA